MEQHHLWFSTTLRFKDTPLLFVCGNMTQQGWTNSERSRKFLFVCLGDFFTHLQKCKLLIFPASESNQGRRDVLKHIWWTPCTYARTIARKSFCFTCITPRFHAIALLVICSRDTEAEVWWGRFDFSGHSLSGFSRTAQGDVCPLQGGRGGNNKCPRLYIYSSCCPASLQRGGALSPGVRCGG